MQDQKPYEYQNGKEATVIGKTFKGALIEYIVEYRIIRLNNEEEFDRMNKIILNNQV